jgi:hypothetical protein
MTKKAGNGKGGERATTITERYRSNAELENTAVSPMRGFIP